VFFRLSLKDVYRVAKAATDNLVSVGASLAHVHVPGTASAHENLSIDGKVEIGMGIHNETGFGKIPAELPDLVKTMLAQLLDPRDNDRAFVHIESTDAVVLLVNNLGGVSPLEFGAIVDETCTQLDVGYSLRPARVLAGTFMTSLNSMGFSISLLKLVDSGFGSGRSILEFIDTPTEATGWTAPVHAMS
jgi:dihydroxyacetone kinase